ncbi:MAG: GTPase [archaeon]
MEKIVLLGAFGRDFHNFLSFFKKDKSKKVIGFCYTQLPLEVKKFPKELCGKGYSDIPIFSETELESFIQENKVDAVYLSYSDISPEELQDKIQKILKAGAEFRVLPFGKTLLKTKIPVIAVVGSRTGSGKSTISRKIAENLKNNGFKVVVLRHPMPYSGFQKVQEFRSVRDLDNLTFEEIEEYYHYVKRGIPILAGVDYSEVLKKAESMKPDFLIWDGGNNDVPFVEWNWLIFVADVTRPGHEITYFPSLYNLKNADIVILTKCNLIKKNKLKKLVEEYKRINQSANVIFSEFVLHATPKINLKDKKVVLVEDSPSLTHGEIRHGAAYAFAKSQKAIILSSKKYAKGALQNIFKKYPDLISIPSLGYAETQKKDVEETINNCPADYVISSTPILKFLSIKKKIINVFWDIKFKKIF